MRPRIVLVCGLLLAAVGCQADPGRAYIEADRKVHTALAPKVREYVTNDAAMSEAERTTFLHLLDDWDFALRRAESYYGLSPPER